MAGDQPGENKQEKKKPKGGKWQYYTVDGDKTSTGKRNCPRCERGVFLATHKDRLACGRCGYTEFLNKPGSGSKPQAQKPEAKPREQRL